MSKAGAVADTLTVGLFFPSVFASVTLRTSVSLLTLRTFCEITRCTATAWSRMRTYQPNREKSRYDDEGDRSLSSLSSGRERMLPLAARMTHQGLHS